MGLVDVMVDHHSFDKVTVPFDVVNVEGFCKNNQDPR